MFDTCAAEARIIWNSVRETVRNSLIPKCIYHICQRKFKNWCKYKFKNTSGDSVLECMLVLGRV